MNRKDMGLIIGILLLAAILYIFFGSANEGSMVVITLDGKPYATCSLEEDKRIEVKSEWGSNIVVIENGQVYVADADCPDQYCVKQGSLPNGRASIICLPHKMVIEVKGDNKKTEVDAISG